MDLSGRRADYSAQPPFPPARALLRQAADDRTIYYAIRNSSVYGLSLSLSSYSD